MKDIKQARQGDVFLKAAELPLMDELEIVERDATGRFVLALGEVTGHAHVIHSKTATLYRHKPTAKLYVVDSKEFKLFHESANRHLTTDHNLIQFPAKTYKVVQQRCYTPAAIVPVAD